MRCKNILNPKHQYQCQMLRQKAINPDEPLSNIQRNKLLEGVNPPKLLIEKAKYVFCIHSFLNLLNLGRLLTQLEKALH